MRIAIIHISDFHIKRNDRFIDDKIDKIAISLNVFGKIDKYIIVFSGDLAFSGRKEEYSKSRYVTGRILANIQKLSDAKVELLMVPGNHDMLLSEDSRKSIDIIKQYESKTIDGYLDDEKKLFENFYEKSNIRSNQKQDKIIDNYFVEIDNDSIQFNLINSAYFSTLKPDDKELHYFPLDKLEKLNKAKDIAITVMHHSCESYHESCKNALEGKIYDNTDLLLIGHDHFSQAKNVSINDAGSLIVSCGGEINFTNQFSDDCFNVIIIDTENKLCNGYMFKWNGQEKIFEHKIILKDAILRKKDSLHPLSNYLKELHDDAENHGKDFTKYFIFPKLSKKNNSNYGDDESIISEGVFIDEIVQKKRIVIYGGHSSGKTTLMKKLYIDLMKDYIPVFLEIYPSMHLKKDKIIRRTFEDQYGDESVKYERFLQSPKNNKVILIDNIDLLMENKSIKTGDFLKMLEETFGYIILSSSSRNNSVKDVIINELSGSDEFLEYDINPFFLRKRNELVGRVCKANDISSQKEIDKINNIIDSLVHNNNELIRLNPSFLVKYIQYFTGDAHYEYVQGENVFNRIFEFDLCNSLKNWCNKNELETYLTIYEFIAFYMFKNKKDTLSTENIRNVIDDYNANYGMSLNCHRVIEVGEKARIVRYNDDYQYYFVNKNHLAYFIAKRLFSIYQLDGSHDYVDNVLKNICFGINSNIIMFYIYLSNNMNAVNNLCEQVDILLKDIISLDLNELNVPLLKKKDIERISAPSKEETELTENRIENAEISAYESSDLKALGVFDYEEAKADNFDKKIERAFSYLEMICKSIPSFYSKMLVKKKEELKNAVYNYPEKLAYVMLEPLNNNCDELCDWFMEYVSQKNIKKKNGKRYEKDDFINFMQGYGIAIVLSLFDHFAEMCTTKETLKFMTNGSFEKNTNKIQRLMMLELESSYETFTKEAKRIIDESNDWLVIHMVRLIVRKYLLTNKSLERGEKQGIVDMFFGEQKRKEYLLKSIKNSDD